MSTEGAPGAVAAVINALKDFRVPPQLSLGAAGTSAVMLWVPKWLPGLTTPATWQPWLVATFVAGVVLFLVGQLVDPLLDQLKVHRARRDAEQAVRAAAALGEQQRRDTEASTQRNLREIAESQAASARAIERDRQQFVEKMTLAEIGICRSFVVPGIRSQSLPITSDVLALTRRDVLHHMAGHEHIDADGSPCSHYTMSDWAWSYFNGRPEALQPPPSGGRNR